MSGDISICLPPPPLLESEEISHSNCAGSLCLVVGAVYLQKVNYLIGRAEAAANTGWTRYPGGEAALH